MGFLADSIAPPNRIASLPVRYSISLQRMAPALADLLTRLRASAPMIDCSVRNTSGSSRDGREAAQSTTRRMAPMGTEPDSEDPAL